MMMMMMMMMMGLDGGDEDRGIKVMKVMMKARATPSLIRAKVLCKWQTLIDGPVLLGRPILTWKFHRRAGSDRFKTFKILRSDDTVQLACR